MLADYKDATFHSNSAIWDQLFQMIEITMRKRPREDSVLSQRKFFKKTAKGKVIKSQPNSDLT
jgi:hypothetical protein